MNTKSLAILGIVISLIGALDTIRKLLEDISNWWNSLSPLIQWILIGLIFYWIYKRKN